MTTFTWQDVGDTADRVLTQSEKEAIAEKWNDYETNEKPIVMLQQLRAERNQRLANTDWWASSDLTMTAEQTAYRQALRDITNTYTSLDDVVWPEEPNV
jgi:hypothetical protein